MKNYGLVVAVDHEIRAIIEKNENNLKVIEEKPFAIYESLIDDNKRLLIINCGCGQELSSIATTYLLNKYKIDILFNYGVVGGLNPKIKYQDTCFVKELIHYEFDTSGIDGSPIGYHDEFKERIFELDKTLIEKASKIIPLPSLRLASGNKFIETNEDRKYLFEEFNCDIVDMELAGICFASRLFNVPLLSIKGVSDSYNEDYNKLAYDSSLKTVDIIMKIIKDL